MGTVPITSTALRALRVLCAVQVVRVQAVVPLRTAARPLRLAVSRQDRAYLVTQIRRRQDGDGVDWGVGGSSAAAAMMRPHKSS